MVGFYLQYKHYVETISNFSTRMYTSYLFFAFIYKYQLGNGAYFIETWIGIFIFLFNYGEFLLLLKGNNKK